MTRGEFLAGLDEVVELPAGTLQGPELLEDLENWTSIAAMGYIALSAEATQVQLSPRQIRECNTVDDLLRLAKIEDGAV